MRKSIPVAALILLTGCATRTIQLDVPADIPTSSVRSASSAPSEKQEELVIPGSFKLDVPFTPQAPFADWNPPFDEACEEASVIIVHHFLTGDPLTRDIADSEIRQLAEWQEQNGYAIDVTVNELAQIVLDYYGYNVRVNEDVTRDSILYEISRGNPVIVPLAGQDIGNPYYSGDGPPYHMLVITGYTRTKFITNDPGTRRGEGYTYAFDTIIDAVHDWNGSPTTIRQGKKAMLIIEHQ